MSIEKWLDDTKHDVKVGNRNVMFGWDKEKAVYLQHASLSLSKEIIDSNVFENYYKFSIVRNPYTRAISVYYYLYDQHKKQFGSFEDYIKALPKFLESTHMYKGSHHIPQTHYTHNQGECFCNQIARFEQLPASLSNIQQHLKINSLPDHHNKIIHPQRPNKHPADIYTKEMIQIMQDVYADDFEAFDYNALP